MKKYEGSILFDTSIDNSKFESGIEKLKKISIKGFAAVGAAAAAGIGAAIKVGSDFEEAMSSVGAISMATGKDLEMLKNAAKEMGESTKYSATQAANALEYLSLAGYSAEESVRALPQVLNLAAAGGMELAYASDLLTDSMAVMGLGIESMENFSDQLAMAASKSNTSVSQLGEAVLVAGGQAKLANMSVSEMNTALGILADKGIKGSEGGTALRNTLKNLYTPTSAAADMLETLGVKTSDASGKLLPLQDVLKKLQDSLGKLNDADKMAAMSEIFDTRTIAAASALLDDCGNRWDELQGYLENCDGAAKQMADTMNDNLKGQLVLAASAAEGLGIQVYESVEGTLKESVKTAAAEISTLTKSLKGGELKPAIENVGKLFSGFADTVVKVSTKAIPPLIKVLGFVGKNFETTTTVVLGAVAAYKSLAIIKTITAWWRSATPALNAYTAAVAANSAMEARGITISKLLTATMSGRELVIGVLSGKISLLTAVQAANTKVTMALNAAWAANPVGIAVAGVALLTAGIVALCAWQKKVADQSKETAANTDVLSESQRAAVNAAKEQAKAYRETKDAAKELAEGELANVDYVANRLLPELKNVVNANGEVKSGYEARADFILGELNDALGTEYTKISEIIGANGELKQSIYDVIEAKKANILLEAYEDTYKEAIKNVAQAEKARAAQAQELAAERETYEQKYLEAKQARADVETAIEDGKSKRLIEVLKSKAISYEKIADEEKEILDKKAAKYSETEAALYTYYDNIASYENASALVIQGKSAEALDSLLKLSGGFQTVESTAQKSADEQKKTLKQQVIDTEVNARLLEDALKKGVSGVTPQMVETAKKQAEKAKSEFQKVGGNLTEGIAKGASKKGHVLTKTMKKLIEDAVEAAKKAGDIRSPSHVMRDEVGKYLSLGVAAGIEENSDEVTKAFSSMLEKLEYRRKFDLISEDEYYAELAKLRDKYLKAGSKEWLSYTEKIYSYQKSATEKQKSDIKQLYDDVSSYADKKLSEVEKKQEDYSKKISSFGSLFNTGTIKTDDETITFFHSLGDIDGQIDEMTRYTKRLENLKERLKNSGISDEAAKSYFSEIAQMSTEDAQKAFALLERTGDDEFNAYLKAYEKKSELAKSYSATVYEDEMRTAIDDSVQYMKDELTNAGFEVPEGFFASGSISAEKFGEGFAQQLDEELSSIRKRIDDFNAQLKVSASAADTKTVTNNINNSNHTSNYTIAPSKGESAHAQLEAAKNFETLNSMRSGYYADSLKRRKR